jgi:dTDP-4-amino-4,6-dideoxygalactose transaminase
VLGPEVEAFEAELAAFVGARYAVGVASGTDAIELSLRAAGIGEGDEVITVALTAVPTVCAIERSGARPVFVDVDPMTLTMDSRAAEAAITPRTKALLPVHLYGQAANLTELRAIADRHRIMLVEDCAQAIGARHAWRGVGTFGELAAFSFYPTKNLGAVGDGGAVATSDRDLADRLRRLRNYGQEAKYLHVERGINSRLDEIQAAMLRVLLKRLPEHTSRRIELARRYSLQLHGVQTPRTADGNDHVYHLYVVRHPAREALAAALATARIGTLIHYPVPVHRQLAYRDLGYEEGSLPQSETAGREILSLPLHIGLSDEAVDEVCAAVETWALALPIRDRSAGLVQAGRANE